MAENNFSTQVASEIRDNVQLTVRSYIMNIDTKELFAAFPHLAKNPSLTIAVFALVVPIVLLFGATEFANASSEALVFFGVLGVSALAYSAWIVSHVKGGRDVSSE